MSFDNVGKKKRGYHDVENATTQSYQSVPSEGDITIPEGDLTTDRLDEFLSLTDRQKICWALQTETRVRLEKVKQRGNYDRISRTLSGQDYLIDLYPPLPADCSVETKSNVGDQESPSPPLVEKKRTWQEEGKAATTLFSDEESLEELEMEHTSDRLDFLENKVSKRKPSRCQIRKRDLCDFKRSSRPFLRQGRVVDESWKTLAHISVTGRDRYYHALSDLKSQMKSYVGIVKKSDTDRGDNGGNDDDDEDDDDSGYFETAPVPPNMLFFRLVLQGYCGYMPKAFHPNDTSLPRSAVMGGAVVAALTSWRNPEIIRIFKKSKLVDTFLRENKKEEGSGEAGENDTHSNVESFDDDHHQSYISVRYRLVRELNKHFLYETSKPKFNNVFSDGDVDIFFQVSPDTRTLMKMFSKFGLFDINLIDQIGSYLGNHPFTRPSLQRITRDITKSERSVSDCAVAVSHHGVSFQFAYDEGHFLELQDSPKPDYIEEFQKHPWPRTSQLIQLKPQADLLGGLLDFDLSCCACAFDGNQVHLTPRSALALQTLTLVVTPFVYQEKRNRQRIRKYWKRGFDPYLVDPYSLRSDKQCSICFGREDYGKSDNDNPSTNLRIDTAPSPFVLDGPSLNSRHDRYSLDRNELETHPCQVVKLKNHPPRTNDEWMKATTNDRISKEELYEYQKQHNVECCCSPNHGKCHHSFALFEKTSDDLINFLYAYNHWDETWRGHVNSVDPRLRMACETCRLYYILHNVVKAARDDLSRKELGIIHNILHDEVACHHWGREEEGGEKFNFYCGATFDSRLDGNEEYHVGYILSRLVAKERMEKVRYLIKNGGHVDGYVPRFIGFRSSYDGISRFWTDELLAAPPRSPIGLNPERFISRCRHCQTWLEGYEYNVNVCESCKIKKVKK